MRAPGRGPDVLRLPALLAPLALLTLLTLLTLVTLLTLLAVTVAGAPASVRARAASPPARFLSVWLPYWNMSAAGSSALAHANQIATASPVWYTVSAGGVVTAAAGAGDGSLVAALRTRGVAVVPTVNESAGLQAFNRMLASPTARARVVRALVGIAKTPGYSGVDLDFEEFAIDPQDDVAAADAAAAGYPRLVAELCPALHAIGRTCIVTVMPRVSAAPVLWRGRFATWVYDYAALGAVADRIRIMAYDEHAPDTPPGPVAPYQWVNRVIAFARSQFPLGRAELGLAAYGYTWGPGGDATFPAVDAAALAASHGVQPAWSAAEQEETFSYGGPRHRTVAWYEDARADLVRERLAAADGFAGVALWAAGDETPALWSDAASVASTDR